MEYHLGGFMDEINLTDPKDIEEQINSVINEFDNALLNLEKSCVTYVGLYDNYNKSHLLDSSIIKAKMKEAVVKAVNDDI